MKYQLYHDGKPIGNPRAQRYICMIYAADRGGVISKGAYRAQELAPGWSIKEVDNEPSTSGKPAHPTN